MCKVHSKVTHIKQQKYFHHLKGRGYNKNSVLYPERLRWWKYFCCFICVTLLWALHIVIKQQFFTFIFPYRPLSVLNYNNDPYRRPILRLYVLINVFIVLVMATQSADPDGRTLCCVNVAIFFIVSEILTLALHSTLVKSLQDGYVKV